MNKTILTLCGLIVVALVGGYFYAGGQMPAAGGTSNFDTIGVTELKVGTGCNDGLGTCTGTAVSQINAGNCVITASANTIAATSSATVECAATGARFGDDVSITVSTSSSVSLFGGLTVAGVSASATNDVIIVKLFNQTGATFTWTALASTTAFQYRVIGI